MKIMSLLAAASAGALALAGIPAIASGASDSATSIPATGVVLQGQLLSDDGAKLVGNTKEVGSELTLLAWPSEEVLAAAGEGEAVKLTPISTSGVAADGTFRFHVSERVDLKQISGGAEIVNVSIAGQAQGREYWYSTTISSDPGVVASMPDSVINLSGDVAVIPSISVEPYGEDNSKALEGQTYEEKACYTSTVATYSSTTAQVGYTANARTGGSSALKFTTGSNGTFGVGVSASGSYGSFSASGSTTLTSGTTISFPATTSGARAHHVYLVPKKYKIYCESNNGTPISTKYEVRPSNYTGGSTTTTVSTFATNSYCTPVGANTTTTISSSTASTISTGFKVSSYIGIDLSSRAGYTTSTSVVLKTTTSAGSVCGLSGYPGGTPGQLKLK